MNTVGKILMTGGIVVLAAGAGAGGMFGVMHFMSQTAQTVPPAMPHPQPKQQIYFAELSDILVSMPPQAGQPSTSYVEFGLQFSTYDQSALTSFATLQPIIKSEIINLLMNQTSSSLQDPAMRAALVKDCLDISNGVLMKDSNPSTTPPFDAAYISNLVVQD